MRTLRISLALLLTALPLLAADGSFASRFPAGANVYVETRGLAGKIDSLLESDLGATLKAHPAVGRLLLTPQVRQALLGQAFLVGATGTDLLGNLAILSSRESALAVYGPGRFLVLTRVDTEGVVALLRGIETLTGSERGEVLPAAAGRPALWRFQEFFVMLQGDLLAISSDRRLITSIRDGVAGGLTDSETYGQARRRIPADAVLFGYVDLEPYRGQLRQGKLPGDLGEALISGAFPHRLRDAPWTAFGIQAHVTGAFWAFDVFACIPQPGEESEAVRESYAGTLNPLPFALSRRTVGVVRLRRSLASLWSHRDALIAERGIPGLVEFETNFGNLTAGMSWVEEFLPNLGDEVILIGMRPDWSSDEPSPTLRLPAGAFLWPLRDAAGMERALRVTFYNTIGIVNASQQGMMEGASLLPAAENYKGVRIETARYEPPVGKTGRSLHVRYNLSPALAVVDGYLVLASSDSIVKMLIDGRGGRFDPADTANADLWIEPSQVQAMLEENREQLIAQAMLRQGDRREAAEAKVDLGLELARFVRALGFTVEESRAAYGARLRLVVARPRDQAER